MDTIIETLRAAMQSHPDIDRLHISAVVIDGKATIDADVMLKDGSVRERYRRSQHTQPPRVPFRLPFSAAMNLASAHVEAGGSVQYNYSIDGPEIRLMSQDGTVIIMIDIEPDSE